VKENEDKTITCHEYDDEENLICEFNCKIFNRNEVWRNEKCGTINAHGETIIPCEYDEIVHLTNGYKVRKDKRWGIFSNNGIILSDCLYDQIDNLGAVYTVRKGKYWGIISNNGVILSDCLYDKITDAGYNYTGEGMFLFVIASINNKYRMLMESPIDETLRHIGDEYDMIEYKYDYSKKDTSGFFAVKFASKWAIADLLNFKLISKFSYSGINYYNENEAEILQLIDNRCLYGFFSLEEKKESVECKYLKSHYDRNCNWVAIYDKKLKKEGVIIDKTNKVAVPFIYDYIRIYYGSKSDFLVIGKDLEYDSNANRKGKFAIANTKMELISGYIFRHIYTSIGQPNYVTLKLLNSDSADINLNEEYIQYQAPLLNYIDYDKVDDTGKCIKLKPFNNLKLFIDIETTGLSLKDSETYENLDNWPYIVQLGFILYDDNFGNLSERNIILKPENYTIPFESTKIHGISNDFAINNGENRSDVLSFMDRILSKVDIIIGHNVEFDLNTLKCEILRSKGNEDLLFRNKKHEIIDTMKMGCDICRIPSYKFGEKYKWPTLDELHTKLFNKSFIGQHNALNDIKATYDCYFEMINNKIYNKSIVKGDNLPF
jgi:DNA polymerase III epsilon subunit-like protein/predicted transposase YbfD/YdcC